MQADTKLAQKTPGAKAELGWRGKIAKQLTISHQTNAAAENKSPRTFSSSPEFYKLYSKFQPKCPTHMSVFPSPSREWWPGMTSINVSSDIQPVASNYCNSTLT